MFDVGLQEMVLIAVLAIVLIPTDELPELMRTLGRYYAKVRRASDDLRRAFNSEVARVDAEKRREDLARRREQAAPPPDPVEAMLPADPAPTRKDPE